MINRYEIWHADTGATLQLDVDFEVLTSELATLINNFWSGAEDRLAAAGGNAAAAVVALAAVEFLAYVLDPVRCLGIEQMQREFDRTEGWPPNGGHGIRLVDFDGRPELESTELVMTEIERT